MYDEKLKGYEGYEEFEDICDVRGFEHAQEGRNMDVTVEDDDIKSCNNFDNIDCIEIEPASYSKGSCNNHAEFIISSFEKCNEEEPCSEHCKCNEEEPCSKQCKCNEEKHYFKHHKCNEGEHYIEHHKCNEEEPYIEQHRYNDDEPYIEQHKCNGGEHYIEHHKCNEEEPYIEQHRYNDDEPYINQFQYNGEEKCEDNYNYNYDYNYNQNSENCLQNNECKPKKQNKKTRNRSYMSYRKGVQVGYRMGYMKAQQELRRRIMYMYNMFQCR